MRPIGFSTGALAYADFRKGLTIITEMGMDTIELSALRISEWEPLLRALPTLDLSSFIYVSVHLPSKMNKEEELVVISSLEKWKDQFKWPLVLHPDAITDWTAWQRLGRTISIENMDMRKQIGRTEAELTEIFTTLPEASFCFDIGHAWQVDPTMSEAYWILKNLS